MEQVRSPSPPLQDTEPSAMPSATTAPPPPPPAAASLAPSFNAYRILSLPSPFNSTTNSSSSSSTAAPPPTALSPAVIKAAYRRALLTHHPDKQQQNQQHPAQHSVDAITAAYKTLLDPSARAAHDRALRLRGATKTADDDGDGDAEEEWRLGLEAVDLDDLAFDEATGRWWRGCRCGAERGFVVDEDALEEEAGAGGSEVLVGCVGCSLWMRVGFAIAED